MKKIILAILTAFILFGCNSNYAMNDFASISDLEQSFIVTEAAAVENFSVSDPVFSIASGEVENGTLVKVSCNTLEAKLYLEKTVNGSSCGFVEITNGQEISIVADTELKAYAVNNTAKSNTVTSDYSLKREVITYATPSNSIADDLSASFDTSNDDFITCVTSDMFEF